MSKRVDERRDEGKREGIRNRGESSGGLNEVGYPAQSMLFTPIALFVPKVVKADESRRLRVVL
jgi:hypothetical protein